MTFKGRTVLCLSVLACTENAHDFQVEFLSELSKVATCNHWTFLAIRGHFEFYCFKIAIMGRSGKNSVSHNNPISHNSYFNH